MNARMSARMRPPRSTDCHRRVTRPLTRAAHLWGMSEETLDREPMWTLDDLCRKLHCSRDTVYHWRKNGLAPRAYKVGRHLLFEEADVRAWLEERAADAVGGSTGDAARDDSSWGW